MIRSLEGLRGAAALMVALLHYAMWVDNSFEVGLIRNAYLFVDVFFVLSGFVIAHNYVDKITTHRELLAFIVRRAGRLYPLFIFSTLAYIAIVNALELAKQILVLSGFREFFAKPDDVEFVGVSMLELVTSLTLTHSLGFFDKTVLNEPSWSISTEFYTYIVFGLMCICFGVKRNRYLYALAFFGAFLISVYASVYPHRCLESGKCLHLTYDYGIFRCLAGFFVGALASNLIRHWLIPQAIHSSAAQLAIFLTAILVVWLSDVVVVLPFAAPLVSVLLILSVATDSGPVARLFNLAPIQKLGLYSYSIYLMQVPVMKLYEPIARRVSSVWDHTFVLLGALVCCLIILILVSAATYRYIEDPFRRRANKLARGLFLPEPLGEAVSPG